MTEFTTRPLAVAPDLLAPDGSEVRVLAGVPAGSMAHFRLAPGAVAKAVRHRTVDELWFVVAGAGRMWRRQGAREEVTELTSGVSLTIPVGTAFQFRAAPDQALDIVGVTMPPWPGPDEAVPADGPWVATV
jgi:mannose-6-phosphate isomerase-like protein (cupin superfamily)